MTREEQENALEVAKLAAFVGSQLNVVDQLYTDRSNVPANKININNFIAQVKNPNANIQPASYLTNIPQGFAAPPSEEMIRQMVPDFTNSSVPPEPVNSSLPTSSINLQPIQATLPVTSSQTEVIQSNISVKSKNTTPKSVESSVLTRSDIDSIRNSLKGIDKSLSNMLNLLKNSKLTTND
jgi:hypothetical protein